MAFVQRCVIYSSGDCRSAAVNLSVPAVGCIRIGLAEASFVMPFMEPYLPYYDSIRDEPAFVELLAEIGDATT